MSDEQKEKRKKLLIIIAASAINLIAITLLVVFIVKYKDESSRIEEMFGSNNNESSSEIVKLGNWSCFALSAFGQIYLEDGQEMEKELDVKVESAGQVKYKQPSANNYTIGAYTIKQSNNGATDIDFHVEAKNGKAFFYEGASNKAALNRYEVILHPKNTSVETSDGQPYQVELSAWMNPKNNSELIAMIVDSNQKGFFSTATSMYCINMD